MNKKIAIVMGSDSDWGIMQKAKTLCQDFEVNTHVQVLSAHRTPEDLPFFL